MIVRRLALLPLALLCLAAAPAPKAAPPKAPAAKAPAAKAPAAKPAPAFDMRDPQALMGLLGEAGASVQTRQRDGDSVFVAVGSRVADFSIQFAGCTPEGRACKAALFDSLLDGAPTSAQTNAFNQTSVMCRVYQDRSGRAHVLYSTVLFASTTRADAATHLAAWQGCLADARDFAKDPVAFLSEAA